MLIENGLSSHADRSPLVKQVTFIDILENCSLDDSNGTLY